MKKLLIILLITTLLLSGCQATPTQITKERDIPKEKSREIDSEQFTSLLQFSAKTSPGILKTTENSLYAPASAYMAFSMLHEGNKDFAPLMEFLESKDIEDTRRKNKELLKTQHSGEYSKLLFANSQWLSSDQTLDKEIQNILDENYHADSFSVDFKKTDKVKKQITEWIDKKTNHFIKNVSPAVEDDMIYILLNTIYLKGTFTKPLIKSDDTMDFQGQKIPYLFTSLSDHLTYHKGNDYKQVLKYLGDEMYISFVLPDTSLESILDQDHLEEIFRRKAPVQEEDAYAKLPFIDIASDIDLFRKYSSMGYQAILNAEYHFLENGNSLQISDVLQQARLALDEHGVEAAAYTEIAMNEAASAIQEKEPVWIIYDRPFFFYVAGANGEIYFTGTFVNPEDK